MHLFLLSALASVATAQRWSGINAVSTKPKTIAYSPTVLPVGIGYRARPISAVAAVSPPAVVVNPDQPVRKQRDAVAAVPVRAAVPVSRNAFAYGGIPPPAYGLPVRFKGQESDRPIRKRADGAEVKNTSPLKENLEFQRKAALQEFASEALDEDLSARSLGLLREIQGASGLPKIDKTYSTALFLESYDDAAQVTEEALQFYLDTTSPEDINPDKLRQLETKAEAANLKRMAQVSRLAGSNELGQALYIKHRQLGSELAEEAFFKKLEDYRAGKKGVTVQDVEIAEKKWRAKKASETSDVMSFVSKYAGGLGPLESLLHLPALKGEQESVDIAEANLFKAEEKYTKDPSQKNRDTLVLAELTFEAAELKERARVARLLGNNLLYNLLYTEAVSVAQEAMDLKERSLLTDYSKAVADGRFIIDDYYEYEEDTLIGYRAGGYTPDASLRITGPNW